MTQISDVSFSRKKFAFDIISEARIEKRPRMEEADPVLKVSEKIVRLLCYSSYCV
jgi:hypothetical protein